MFGQNKTFGSSSFGSGGGGGSGLFGNANNQNKSIFGNTTNQNTGSSLFGGNQNKPAGSLFGSSAAQPQQSSGLFGSPQTQNTGSSLFGGQSNANKGLFGGGTTNTGSSLFGSSNNNTGGSSLFGGGSNTTSGGGLFGSSNTAAVSGTTIKFEPVVGSDTMMRNGSSQNISTKHICITAMPKYESKSVEELRIDDYMANRKQPGVGTTTGGGGLFGSSNTNQSSGGGLFGSSTPQKSMFGGATNTTSSPFGGNTQTQTNSLFGSNTANQGSSLFGAKPAASGGLFGSSNTGNAFGGTSTGTSIFGNNNQAAQPSTSLFGQQQQPQQQQSSLFGNTNNTGGSLFGNNANQNQQSTGFNFGGNATSTFGQPATSSTGGGLFGSTNTATTGTSLFGAKPAATTGGFNFGNNAATTTTNAFGQPNATTGGGLFGNTAAKPLFGNTGTTGATGGGLFGSQPATGGGLFGSNTATNQPLTTGFGNVAQPSIAVQPQVAPIPVIGVTADVLQMQANMKSLQSQLTSAPYGDSPLMKYNMKENTTSDVQSSAQRQARFLAAKKGITGLSSPMTENSSFIAGPITKIMSDLSPAVRSADVSKDLNYTSREAPPTLGKGLRTGTSLRNSTIVTNRTANESIANRTIDSALDASINGTSNRLGVRGSTRKSNLKQLDLSVLGDASRFSQSANDSHANDPDALPVLSRTQNANEVSSPQNDPIQAVTQRNQVRDKQPPTLNLDSTADDTSCVATDQLVTASNSNTSFLSANTAASNQALGSSSVENSAAGVKLSKPDYFTIPTINEMKNMTKDGCVVIEDGLTIGRASYGSVFWPGRIEIKNVNLDEIVVFRHKEVTVYPNEEEKPDEGEGLNRPAEVTLERIWYMDKKSKKEIRDVITLTELGWREHLERQTIRMGATFKDYRPESGSWVFRVEHFSKYGLDDDDEPLPVKQVNGESAPLQAVDLNSSVRDVHSQVQRKKVMIGDKQKSREGRLDSSTPSVPILDTITGNVVRQLNAGLGGGLAQIAEDRHFMSTNREYQQIDDSVMEIGRENGPQPEKKPKLEILADLEYESSKYIKNMAEVRMMPKCVDKERRFEGGVPANEMIGYGKSRLIDLSIVQGRSSRVGWSENGSLVWSAQPEDNQILWGTIDRTSDVNEETLGAMIDVNIGLSESRRKGTQSTASSFNTYSNCNYSEMLAKYTEISSAGGYDAHSSVWKLCSALFPSTRNNGWNFERGEQVGEWLRYESANKSNNQPATNRKDPMTKVWQQLTVGNLEKAFEIASEANLLNLASSLYASSVSPEATAYCYKKQIESWKKSEVLHLIPHSTLKCYLILSGVSHMEWSLNGKNYSVNCLENLHWTQALGIHMWYLRGWDGLEETYLSYNNDVKAGRAQSNRGDLYGELIKLACESQHSVEVVLDCAAGESPHDYFLMWHVWSVLYSVGYRTMSKIMETKLHRSYSSQLEDVRLAKHALYVIQHIENDTERATAVKSLLIRVAKYTDNDLFDSVSEGFDIPREWISEAQFVIAKSVDDPSQLFELAVEAKDLTEIQRIFVDEIAPTAVTLSDFLTLRRACQMIKPLEDQIPGFGANGMIYVEYSKLIELFENDGDEELVKEVVNSLETRLHAPNIKKNSVQKIALQTIAQQIFEHSAEHNSLSEWTKLLGHRQMFKMFRNNSAWGLERFTIEFD